MLTRERVGNPVERLGAGIRCLHVMGSGDTAEVARDRAVVGGVVVLCQQPIDEPIPVPRVGSRFPFIDGRTAV